MLIISSVAVLLIFLIVLILFVRNSYVKNIAESFFILTIAAALFTTTLAILLYYAKYSSSFYLLNKFLFLDYNLLGRFARVNVTLLQISDLLSMSRIFFMIGLFGFLLSITGDQEVPPSRLAMIVMVLTIILMLLNLSPIYILCMHIIRRSRVSLTSAINVFDLINKASMVPAIILLLARWMSIRQKAAAPRTKRAISLMSLGILFVTVDYILIMDLTPSSLGNIYRNPLLVTFLNNILYKGWSVRRNIALITFFIIAIIGSFTLIIASAVEIIRWKNLRKVANLTISKNVHLADTESLIAFLHSVKNQIISLGKFEELCTAENFEEYMPVIRQITAETSHMIDKIYDNAKPLSIVISYASLTECVRQAVSTVSRENDTPIYFHEGAQEEYAMIDVQQITHAIENILYNAGDACREKPDGRIDIRFEKKGVDLGQDIKEWNWDRSREITITISDNGVGISNEELSNVFQPFYSTKNRSHSWGMGLHHVLQIVNAHRGSIKINSEVGEGTQVSVTLPTGR